MNLIELQRALGQLRLGLEPAIVYSVINSNRIDLPFLLTRDPRRINKV
jgi:hypothetical protein